MRGMGVRAVSESVPGDAYRRSNTTPETAGGGVVVLEPLRDVMAAYDGLPEDVRRCLYEANRSWSPIQTAKIYERHGRVPDWQVVDFIRRQDAQLWREFEWNPLRWRGPTRLRSLPVQHRYRRQARLDAILARLTRMQGRFD